MYYHCPDLVHLNPYFIVSASLFIACSVGIHIICIFEGQQKPCVFRVFHQPDLALGKDLMMRTTLYCRWSKCSVYTICLCRHHHHRCHHHCHTIRETWLHCHPSYSISAMLNLHPKLDSHTRSCKQDLLACRYACRVCIHSCIHMFFLCLCVCFVF